MSAGSVEVSYFPEERHQPLFPGSEPDLIRACTGELAILGAIGGDQVVIPETNYEIATGPNGNPGITVIRNRLDAEPFTPGVRWPGQGEDAPNQEAAATLAEILLEYYGGVLTEQRPLFLGNIAPAEAWAVTQLGELALLRTAPFMIGGQEGIAVPNIKTQVSIVYDWVRNLQPHGSERNEMLRNSVFDTKNRLDEIQNN